MKYKPGTEVVGLLIKEHKGRELICVCMNCQKETRIALTSISRKRKANRIFCQDCLQRRIDDDYIIESALYDFQKKAAQRQLSWNLAFDQFKSMILDSCHYCSAPPSSTRFSRMPWNSKIPINGIDRKNNSVGYEIENCVSCCGICNRAKSSMSYQDFMKYINRIKGEL